MSAKPTKKGVLFNISEYNPTEKLPYEVVLNDNPIIEATEALRSSLSSFVCKGNNFTFDVYSLGIPNAIMAPKTKPHKSTTTINRLLDHKYLHNAIKSISFSISTTGIKKLFPSGLASTKK